MEINIQRINELARKAKAEGLTPAEKEEQQKLRREYIAAVKMNLRTQLDNIDMQEKDEIRFMKGWKLKELEKIMPAWQRRQCEEIKRERWRGF